MPPPFGSPALNSLSALEGSSGTGESAGTITLLGPENKSTSAMTGDIAKSE